MKTLTNLYQVGERNIMLVGRDKDGKRLNELVTNFVPYFYSEDENGSFKSIFGKNLKKIVTRSPGEVRKVREQFGRHYEADIPYLKRFLVDKYDKFETAPLRICYIDIETASSVFSKEISYSDAITCITCYDNFDKELLTFVWHPRMKEAWMHNSEIEMLNEFIKWFVKKDFDIITGWNINAFDVPYIIERCNKLSVDINKLSMSQKLTTRSYLSKAFKRMQKEYIIDGRYSFDMMIAYRVLTGKQLDSYALQEVSKKELGEGKVEIVKDFAKLWLDRPEDLIKYNRQDVRLLYKLDEKLKIIQQYNERRIEWACTWEDLWLSTGHHDILFLRKARKMGVILPSRGGGEDEESIKGGFVLETTPGIHTNVAVFDVNSMYPSIIKTFNVSIETIDSEGEISIGNGVKFRKGKKGIYSLVVEDQLQTRAEYRKAMKETEDETLKRIFDMRQNAAKVAGNEIFGIADNKGFRLSDRRISSSITFMGQEIAKAIADLLRKKDYKVIYSDTDSVMVKLKTEDIFNEGNVLLEEINSFLKTFPKKYGSDESHLAVKFEKVYSKVLFGKSVSEDRGVKKRYKGSIIKEDGTTADEVKGFEIIRSDSAPITRIVQKRIIDIAFEGGGKREINAYVNGIKQDLKDGKYNPKDYGLPKKYMRNDYANRKDPYLDGKKWAEKNLGIRFMPQSTLRKIYMNFVPKTYEQTKVMVFEHEEQLPPEFISEMVVDWNKQFPPLIENMVERLIDALDLEKRTRDEGGLKKWFTPKVEVK